MNGKPGSSIQTFRPSRPSTRSANPSPERHPDRLAALYATPAAIRFASFEPLLEDLGTIDMSDAWRRARPMQLDWVRNIRDQCIATGVPFFFKQDAVHGRKVPLPELDGRKWRQFPIVPTWRTEPRYAAS